MVSLLLPLLPQSLPPKHLFYLQSLKRSSQNLQGAPCFTPRTGGSQCAQWPSTPDVVASPSLHLSASCPVLSSYSFISSHAGSWLWGLRMLASIPGAWRAFQQHLGPSVSHPSSLWLKIKLLEKPLSATLSYVTNPLPLHLFLVSLFTPFIKSFRTSAFSSAN